MPDCVLRKIAGLYRRLLFLLKARYRGCLNEKLHVGERKAERKTERENVYSSRSPLYTNTLNVAPYRLIKFIVTHRGVHDLLSAFILQRVRLLFKTL